MSGLIKAAVTCCALVLVIILGNNQDVAANGRIKILLLGDSYIAGNGARKTNGTTDNYGPRGCYRSNSNWGTKYAHQLKLLGYEVTVVNRACSGAVSNDILYDNDMEQEQEWVLTFSHLNLSPTLGDSTLLNHLKIKGYCPTRDSEEEYYRINLLSRNTTTVRFECRRYLKAQINFLDPSIDLVLMSIGGNDAGFSEIATNCFAPLISSVNDCKKAQEDADGFIRNDQHGSYKKNMQEIFTKMRAKLRGDAKIALVNYPYLAKDDNFVLNEVFGGGSYEASKNVRLLGELGDQVQASVIPAPSATQANAYFFDGVKSHFVGHEPDMGDFWNHNPDKWMNTFGSRISADWFHYNPLGHQEVANVLGERLHSVIDGFPSRTKSDYDVVFVLNHSAEANAYQGDNLSDKSITVAAIRDKIMYAANSYRFGLVSYNIATKNEGEYLKSAVTHDFTTDIGSLGDKLPGSGSVKGPTFNGELREALLKGLNLKWRPGVKKLIYIIGKTPTDEEVSDVAEHYEPVIKKAKEIDPAAVSTVISARYPVSEVGLDYAAIYLAENTDATVVQFNTRNAFSSNGVANRIERDSIKTPYAWAGTEAISAKIGDEVEFDGSGSTDELGIIRYEWDFDHDGEYDAQSADPEASHIYQQEYQGLTMLRVTNVDGKTALGSIKMTVTTDGDVIEDEVDNCPLEWNEDQSDVDNDGWGDICDHEPEVPGYQNTPQVNQLRNTLQSTVVVPNENFSIFRPQDNPYRIKIIGNTLSSLYKIRFTLGEQSFDVFRNKCDLRWEQISITCDVRASGSWTAPSQGTDYEMFARAFNENGVKLAQSEKSTFSVDTEDPELIRLEYLGKQDGDAIFEVDARDNYGVDSVTFLLTRPRMDGSCNANEPSSIPLLRVYSENDTFSARLNTDSLNPGEYCVFVTVRDEAWRNTNPNTANAKLKFSL